MSRANERSGARPNRLARPSPTRFVPRRSNALPSVAAALLIALIGCGPPAQETGSSSSGSAAAPAPSEASPAGDQAQMAALRREALDVVGRLVAEYPDVPAAQFARGLVNLWFRNRDTAEQCFEQCVRVNPNFANAYYCLGWIALDRGRYDESVQFLQKALDADPELAPAYAMMGKALMGAGRGEEAVAALNEHIRLAPRPVESYLLLGQARLCDGRYEQAKQYYKAAVDIYPQSARAYYGLAAACMRSGQEAEAQKYRRQFHQLKANDPSTRSARERLDRDLAATRRTASDAYVAAGKVYKDQADHQKVEDYWRKAAELDPNDSESRELLVSLYERQGKLLEAIPLLEELSRIDPGNVRHLVNLGVLHTRLKQFDAAEKTFLKLKELAPNRREGYVPLIQVYLFGDRDPAEALRLARKLVQLEPIAPNYDLLGKACESNKDLPGALSAYQRASELDPGVPTYRDAYARIQTKMKQGGGGESEPEGETSPAENGAPETADGKPPAARGESPPAGGKAPTVNEKSPAGGEKTAAAPGPREPEPAGDKGPTAEEPRQKQRKDKPQ